MTCTVGIELSNNMVMLGGDSCGCDGFRKAQVTEPKDTLCAGLDTASAFIVSVTPPYHVVIGGQTP
jgi:hypothetical protein